MTRLSPEVLAYHSLTRPLPPEVPPVSLVSSPDHTLYASSEAPSLATRPFPFLGREEGLGKFCVDFVFVWQRQKSGMTNQIAVFGM